MTDARDRWLLNFLAWGFVMLSGFVIRNLSFMIFRRSSRFWNRKRLRFLRFVFPFLNAVVVDATQGEQFFFVVNHLFAAGAGERIVFHQENRLLRTNLLAIAAEDAAEHVDLKFFRHLLRVRAVGDRPFRAWRNDFDSLGRADKFAELAGDALGVAFLVARQVRRSAIALRHDRFLFRILHRRFLPEEVTQCDFEPTDDRRQVKPLPETQFFSFNNHLFPRSGGTPYR